MTQERASEIIRGMPKNTQEEKDRVYDLFGFFWVVFKLNAKTGTQFAELCGFGIVEDVELVREEKKEFPDRSDVDWWARRGIDPF